MRSTHKSQVSALALVIAVSVAMRLGMAFYMGDQVRAMLPGINDEITYHSLALSLLAGKGYQFVRVDELLEPK